jgi:hypothetical protein
MFPEETWREEWGQRGMGTEKENFIGVGVGIGKRRFKGSKRKAEN